MWLLVIFLSPTEDSNSHSSSGIDVNPYQIRSQGGGFICMRIVPRTDVILIASANGTFAGIRRKDYTCQNFLAILVAKH
jgi:hypothetical protein